jgi:hypothetical protein
MRAGAVLKISRLLILVLLCAFLGTGCDTTFREWSGKMPNQNTRHYVPPDQPYQYGESGEQAARLVTGLARRR